MNKPIHSYTPQPIKQKYTTHTKLDYKPPLSLKFNGKELQILEWGEVKGDSLDSKQYDKQRIFTARNIRFKRCKNRSRISNKCSPK